MSEQIGTVYLLHFTKPYKHAQHYIGWTHEGQLANRLARHRDGFGSNLVRVIIRAGIDFVLARTWEGATRSDEQKLKARGGACRICPVCKAERGAFKEP